MSPQPPRQPMKQCPYCYADNEPSRTRCVDCGAAI